MSESPYVVDVDRETFHARIVETSRRVPVLVDFWAEWCAPCRMLSPVLDTLAEEYGGAFILAKVNTDEQQVLATEYGIRSLPTVLLIRDAEVIEQFSGVQPESTIRALLDRHVERASDRAVARAQALLTDGAGEEAMRCFRTALTDDPENHRVHVAFAAALIDRAEYAEAERVLHSLPAGKQEDDEVRRLFTRLTFARAAAGAAPVAELVRSIAADPGNCEARYQLGALKVQAEDYEGAMEQLLEIMRRDRGFKDDAGRKGLVELYGLLGRDDERVARYRSLMAQVLH